MERTMMRSVCAAGNLIAAVQEEGGGIRQVLAPVLADKGQDPDNRIEYSEPSITELSWETPSDELDRHLRRFLDTAMTPIVARCRSYTSNSIRYTTHRHSPGDSHIRLNDRRFGRIADIVAYSHDGTLKYAAFVALFIPLGGETAKKDPYREWGDVAGKLLHADPEDPRLLSFDVVRGHAAFREYEEEGGLQLVHMMALDKVVRTQFSRKEH